MLWLFSGLGCPFLPTIHLPPVSSYLSLRHHLLREAFQDPSQAQSISRPSCIRDSPSGNVRPTPSAPLGRLLMSVRCPHLLPSISSCLRHSRVRVWGFVLFCFSPWSQRTVCRRGRIVRGKGKCWGKGRRWFLSAPKRGAGLTGLLESSRNNPPGQGRTPWQRQEGPGDRTVPLSCPSFGLHPLQLHPNAYALASPVCTRGSQEAGGGEGGRLPAPVRSRDSREVGGGHEATQRGGRPWCETCWAP